MAIFKKPSIKTQQRKRREIPQGLFQKCPGCNEVIHEIELNENLRVCPRCDYHFAQSAKDRIASLLDPDTFVETDARLSSIDTLKFQGMASYKDRLRKYQDNTGLIDAVLSGYGMIEGYKVAIAVMDFSFLAATMGSVVGERITFTIEYGTANRAAVIIVPASGVARDVRRNVEPDANGENEWRPRAACQTRVPYISVLESGDRQRHGQ